MFGSHFLGPVSRYRKSPGRCQGSPNLTLVVDLAMSLTQLTLLFPICTRRTSDGFQDPSPETVNL